jgi:hypothetical protein
MFVSTSDGFVNLDDVVRIKLDRSRTLTVLTLRNGDTVTSPASLYDLVAEARPLVPAAAGTEAVLVWFSAEGNDRPTIDDIEVGRTAVVAWRVHGGTGGGYGEPILVDEPSDNQHVLLPQSDGTLLEPSNAVFRNLDAAKASVLEDEQQRYDAEQAREERA